LKVLRAFAWRPPSTRWRPHGFAVHGLPGSFPIFASSAFSDPATGPSFLVEVFDNVGQWELMGN
jgi:hypothetical protein